MGPPRSHTSFSRTIPPGPQRYRPAFRLAAAAAVGGDYRNALNTGAAIELLHSAFLIKDDVVDQSLYRRGDLTLNRKYGLALAANAGDALKILSMSPLIDNLEVIGVGSLSR